MLRARAPFSAKNILVLKMDIWSKVSYSTIKVYKVVTIFSPKMALYHPSPPVYTISRFVALEKTCRTGPTFSVKWLY